MPVEWDWVNNINNSLDLLSQHNAKARSYSLKPYFNYVWSGVRSIQIKKNVIGGMGRSGYDKDREYDIFDGLIFKKNTIAKKFELDEEISWTIKDVKKLACPIDYLDEFIISVTNSPPTVNERATNKLVGLNKPQIYMLLFDGKGHDIFVINGWGWSIIK